MDRTLTVNGLSKGYAMTGWRLGWLIGPTPVMKLAAKMNGQTVTSAATFTMEAAVAVLGRLLVRQTEDAAARGEVEGKTA